MINEYWEKGPNVFLNTLFGILIRFHENVVGFPGDIRDVQLHLYSSIGATLVTGFCAGT